MQLALIIYNVRSAHNVGSMIRTAEGLGVDEVYLAGYTPYPEMTNDKRLPHLWQKQARQIHKTALGAEYSIKWSHQESIDICIDLLIERGFVIAALEQTPSSKPLNDFRTKFSVALIVGNEITGLDTKVLERSSHLLQIPMEGRKESFNVAIAAAIAIYHIRRNT